MRSARRSLPVRGATLPALLATLLAATSAALAQSAASCPPYPQSALYRPRLRQVPANPSNWVALIQGALAGDEVLLADGTYDLPPPFYTVQISQPITVRGASGNRAAVLVRGPGYGPNSEGFMVHAQNVTLADLSMTAIRNHAISIKGESGAEAPHVYNVHLYDVGTQHLKSTPGDGVAGGVVACSRIGYTPGAVRGDYVNAIDVHRGIDWLVRDNEIYNLWGDGTGCEVDDDCGTYTPGGGPAILFWNLSRGTVVERNRIVESFRGIALGFGQGDEHQGGTVRNNFFYQTRSGGDMGIAVFHGLGTTVDHNTVLLGPGGYPGAIEVRGASTVSARNNLLDRPLWDRGDLGGNTLTLQGNKQDAAASDFLQAGAPHLAVTSAAVDFMTTVNLPAIGDDLDRDARPQGVRRDAGCDERAVCTLAVTPLDFFTVPPCRLVDTRLAAGANGGPALAAGLQRTLALAPGCGVPASARALSVNVTAVAATGSGNLRFTPGACPPTLASTLNFTTGTTRANNALLTLAPGGTGTVVATASLAGGGVVHLVIDVNGWFE